MAATNRADMLDQALLRPGRFDRIVNVDLPDKEGRLAILELHTKGKPLAPDVDLGDIARQTFGFSGAHLESVANEAAILALREQAEVITSKHLTEAVDKVILGEKMDRKMNDAEKRRVSIHEAGHALVGEWVEAGSVSNVTVTPRGRAMGYVRTNPPDDHYIYTKQMLEGSMRVALGGFLAEEVIYGEASTGASGDFERVMDLARRLVYSGLTDLGIVDPESLGKDQEGAVIRKIVAEQQALVREYLAARKDVLNHVADILVAEEVIQGDTLRELLAQIAPTAA